MQLITDSIKRRNCGKYELSFPFKVNINALEDDENLAMLRLNYFFLEAKKCKNLSINANEEMKRQEEVLRNLHLFGRKINLLSTGVNTGKTTSRKIKTYRRGCLPTTKQDKTGKRRRNMSKQRSISK